MRSRPVCFGESLRDVLLSGRPGIEFVLRRRRDVGETGEKLAIAVDIDGDVLDAIDDLVGPRIDEDDIAVFSHHFRHETLCVRIAHLVDRIDREFDDALSAWLAHLRDAPAEYVLAKQHAKRGSARRIIEAALRQIDGGTACLCADQQPSASLSRVQLHDEHVGFNWWIFSIFARPSTMRLSSCAITPANKPS